ncbi:MAG TPA: AraC family transcriptional regulator [Planctomycetota bacterium]|nr:AraC family transcriptional regulator [Planctomycetota bacterium]
MKVFRAESFLTAERPFHVAVHRHYTAGEHRHERFLEFFYTLQGRGIHRVNGVEHAVMPGTLVLVREHDVHSMQGAGVRHVNVAFTRQMAEDAARFLNSTHWLLRLNDPGRPLAVTLQGRARADFQRRLAAACDQFPSQDMLLRALLLDVLQRILYRPAPETSAPDVPGGLPLPVWLEELCALLQDPQFFLRPVAEIPALARKSPEHLARSFRRYLRVTPTDYLNARRLDCAARLLSTTEKKILTIAYECGFDQPGYFYRLFHRRFGRTPRQYRLLGQQILDPTA